MGSGTADLLPLARLPVFDVGGCGGKIAVEPRESAARLLLLAEIAERHAELQQIVGSLAALGIFLIAQSCLSVVALTVKFWSCDPSMDWSAFSVTP